MAGNAKDLGTRVVGPADRREPVGTAAQDGGRDCDALNIVDGRGTAIETHIGGKWRLQSGLTLLAFKAFQQRRFFATDIGAGAMMDVKVEIPSMDVALADQPLGICFIHGAL